MIRSLVVLFVVLFVVASISTPAFAQCGFNDMQFSVTPANPTVGQPITITGTNTSSGCIWNQSDSCLIDFVKKFDCNGATVLSPACLQVITPINPGFSTAFTWDQLDDNGVQVPAGAYVFDISLTNFNGQSLSHCIAFSIGGGSCPPASNYGSASVGTGGIAPTLTTAGGLPQIGNVSFALQIANGLGGADSLTFVGLTPTTVNAPWGTLLVDLTPPFLQLPLPLGGGAGVPGAGGLTLPAPLPNDGTLVGISVYLQTMIADGGSTGGISHSPGLTFTFCQ